MIDRQSRNEIATQLGEALDDLVADLHSEVVDGVSTVQEAEISSRLCQRLEDRLDGNTAGDYTFRVIAQSVPDRGPKSMENLLGADIFLSVSLDGPDGFDKGIFVQAKYDRNIEKSDLDSAMQKMQKTAGSKGSYVWVYSPNGIKVYSAGQVKNMDDRSFGRQIPRSVEGFTKRILDCFAGTRDWGISERGSERRIAVAGRLREARASSIIDLNLERIK